MFAVTAQAFDVGPTHLSRLWRVMAFMMRDARLILTLSTRPVLPWITAILIKRYVLGKSLMAKDSKKQNKSDAPKRAIHSPIKPSVHSANYYYNQWYGSIFWVWHGAPSP